MKRRSLRALAVALTVAMPSASHGAEDRPAQDRPAAASAVELIRARCIFCHGPALMLALSQRVLDTGGMPALDVLLAGHHAPDAAARAAIVDFLEDPMGSAGE